MGTLKSHALPDVAAQAPRVATPRGRPLRKALAARGLGSRWLPMLLTVLFAYLGTMLWTARVSLSNSRTFPSSDFAGLTQYVRLFHNDRWLVSLQHIVLYGGCFIVACLVIGLLLAIFIDQRVAAEGVLRTVFLYPYAMSFVATGLVWQVDSSIPNSARRRCCASSASRMRAFDWIVDQDFVVYTIVIATVWQASGLVMALLLAGLRGIDDELWKAARVDGIPRWRVYASIVVPMLGPSLSTAFVLLFVMVVKLYDAVVAMTQGGPGTASEVPAKFIHGLPVRPRGISALRRRRRWFCWPPCWRSSRRSSMRAAAPPPERTCNEHAQPFRRSLARSAPTRGAGTAEASCAVFAGTRRHLCVSRRGRAVLPAAAVCDARDVGEADVRNQPRQSARVAGAIHAATVGAMHGKPHAPGSTAMGFASASGIRCASSCPARCCRLPSARVNGYALSFWRPARRGAAFGRDCCSVHSFRTR